MSRTARESADRARGRATVGPERAGGQPDGESAGEPAVEQAGPSTAPAEPVDRLPRRGLIWRLVATAAVLGVLATAQVVDTDDFWPLGSLSQYGAPKDVNGTIRSVYVEALFEGETQPRTLGLSAGSTGIQRGEIEGQLGRFIDDPSLLQQIADSYAELRPDRPQPEVLYLRRSVTQLENGRAVGEPTIETLAEWQVQP
ncbi:hypothetical protein [Miniimonas sp. S16]|nr:hypothetical protein [Miniimonas sp. S16]